MSKKVLLERLRERRLPEDIIQWVDSFCSGRKGCVMVNGQCSSLRDIEHLEIPQGSPLSPILYILYNAGLVEGPINKEQGTLGFVDDYTAWVTGPCVSVNTETLQQKIMPKVEDWERKSGVTFEAEKTTLIHFTRDMAKDDTPAQALTFQGQEIQLSQAVKILIVTLDKKLQMRDHIARATTNVMKQCLAIKRLKGMRPRAMRQLFNATVTPITDYAALCWYGPNMVGRVQWLGAQVITRAFKTVALPVLEAEAGLYFVESRLKKRVGKHLTGLYSLPKDNPVAGCVGVLRSQGGRWQSPLRHT